MIFTPHGMVSPRCTRAAPPCFWRIVDRRFTRPRTSCRNLFELYFYDPAADFQSGFLRSAMPCELPLKFAGTATRRSPRYDAPRKRKEPFQQSSGGALDTTSPALDAKHFRGFDLPAGEGKTACGFASFTMTS